MKTNAYVVMAKSKTDMDSLHDDLIGSSSKVNIPDRIVSVSDLRELNDFITHYYLTDDEAATLIKDPRVALIHLDPPRETIRHNVQILNATETPKSYNNVAGNFNRNATNDTQNVNWGLRRTSLATPESTVGKTYSYDVDGTGVDVVIMDDGVQDTHPEFLNNSGVSRVQKINWYATSATPTTPMPVGYYDYTNSGEAEHGTHVAGIACGKTYGYAKNANIYSMRIFDNTYYGTKSFTNSIGTAFDLILAWHNCKPIDPTTGHKRPTIVNMSWGYVTYYSGNSNNPNARNITNILYRGASTNYSGTSYLSSAGQVGPNHGFRVPSIDAQIAQGQAAGIIYVVAAGNYGHKIDISSGPDWNNSYKLKVSYIAPAGTAINYHQGGSPIGTIRVMAGDISTVSSSGLKEQLASYSERGPGCDIISPGSYITSSTSLLSTFTKFSYVFGTSAQTTNKACKISGTSMATPQVTGVLALHLTRHPETTPAQAKTWIANTSKHNLVYNPNTANNAWTASTALLTAPNVYLYNPYHNGFTD
jgi:hypothetical protein